MQLVNVCRVAIKPDNTRHLSFFINRWVIELDFQLMQRPPWILGRGRARETKVLDRAGAGCDRTDGLICIEISIT